MLVWFAQLTLQYFIIDPAVSHCLLADSSFIAETSQQAFDGQEWGVFLSYQAQIIDHKWLYFNSSA